MDIIDIILARALTPQGQVNTYAAKAQKAAQDAAAAATSAQSVANNMESISNQITTTGAAAQQAVVDANTALATVNEALATLDEGTISYEDIDAEIGMLMFSGSGNSTDEAYTTDLEILYPDGTTDTVSELVTMYKQAGQSQTGTMTQAAITNLMNSIKRELELKIAQGGGGGGTVPIFPSSSAGYITIIDRDGRIIAGDTTEASIINALIKSGTFQIKNASGLEIDYANRSSVRIIDAQDNFDINNYSMYGGRMRCNVNDNGEIVAWYGDRNYRDDGSNGQVMIYQPKFYYNRVPIETEKNTVGNIIRKESIIISPVPATSFKIHPLFLDDNGNELDYVLIGAYEGCAYDVSENEYIADDRAGVDFTTDKLSSVAGVQPITGKSNNLTISTAETLAANRGEGWHITNMKCESANQMLQIVEFGSFNGQESLELGICDLDYSLSKNWCCLTGSTASLGNSSGAAAETIQVKDGVRTAYNVVGKRAVSYRGFENPWGNAWRMIGGVILSGNGSQDGGVPYICDNYTYADSAPTTDYHSMGVSLPNNVGWVSAMGYGNSRYDWIFMPVECNIGNSSVPVGDNIWTTANLSGQNMLSIGGRLNTGDSNGAFYYAGDTSITAARANYNARLMFIPTKNSIYDANISKWQAKVGG